jgi:ElaA protein
MKNYTVKCVTFNELTTTQLYEIMVLRQEVFVVEQNCAFLDADGKDFDAHHLIIYDDKQELLAYTRLLQEGLAYKNYTSIGRVVNHPSTRGSGIGKDLMQYSISWIEKLFGTEYPIKIGAQSYLIHFYEKFGFVSQGDDYMEDGIPHRIMVRVVL